MKKSIFTEGSRKNQLSISDSIIVDLDGNVYKSITICKQTWSKTNLNVSKYNDGTEIPEVSDPTILKKKTIGAWCYYRNNSENGVIYGKLYNWYAVAGIYDDASLLNPALRKKIAPKGWHVPTDDEWTILIKCLGKEPGSKLKEKGTSHWSILNLDATNSSGFTGIPGGARFSNYTYSDSYQKAFWWSSSKSDNTDFACSLSLSCYSEGIGRAKDHYENFYSVRFIKN